MEQFSADTIEKVFSDSFDSLTESIKAPKVLVAFSGGLDSLALLILCVKKLGDSNVFPLYVNHCIRSSEELEEEISLNKSNCSKLGLNLNVVKLDKDRLDKLSLTLGTEAAARKLRYEILNRYSENLDFIVTAHHFDDQIETVVMKQLKNSPITSLRGISSQCGKVIRPLLNIRKSDLELYVSEKGFKWSSDSTNTDNGYFRNYVRNVYIPQQKSVNKNFENEILSIRNDAFSKCGNFEWSENSIDLDLFRSLSYVKKTIVLFSMWDRLGLGKMSKSMIDRIINASEKSSSIESASGCVFCVYEGFLYCVSEKDNSVYSDFETGIAKNMVIPGFEVKFDIDSSDFKAVHIKSSQLSNNAVIRFPRTEDYITLNGGTVGVQKLLKDMKVPFVFRQRTPILFDQGKVVAVFASVWGKKDRVAAAYKENEWKCEPCFKFTCLIQ